MHVSAKMFNFLQTRISHHVLHYVRYDDGHILWKRDGFHETKSSSLKTESISENRFSMQKTNRFSGKPHKASYEYTDT